MKNRHLGPQIKELHNQGYKYQEIADQLQCSLGSVCYHLGDDQKRKCYNRRKNINRIKNKCHPFKSKIRMFIRRTSNEYIQKITQSYRQILSVKLSNFCNRTIGGYMHQKNTIKLDDVINKFGQHPKCYLTGEPIDITKTTTYNFDHIIPISKGGENTLDNLGLATKKANFSKNDMTPQEFFDLCHKVLEHQGYKVVKP